jgi:excinuclease ABC subunit C
MNMKSTLKKIQIQQEDKKILEVLSGQKIYTRNSFMANQSEISDLMEQAQQNTVIYLERNKLGQTLSIFEENTLFTAVVDLQHKLGLSQVPRRIECYDISHLSGKFVYGSMVTFLDGRPAKKFYKLFKTKEQNNDFENHKEVMKRRLLRGLEWEKGDHTDKHDWKLPDLIIVDGGKGQLSGDFEVLVELGLESKVAMCALAKREEEVFVPHNSEPILVEGQTRFLVQRIRDEAHRFAITSNRNARLKTAHKSKLDTIPGIGQVTKQKLLSVFGSVENIINTLYSSPEMVYELVGPNITEKLKKEFGVMING